MKAYRKPGWKVKLRSQFHADFIKEKLKSVVDSILDRLERGSGHIGDEESVSYHKETVNSVIYMVLHVVLCFQVTKYTEA
jgi:hypothetical protein